MAANSRRRRKFRRRRAEREAAQLVPLFMLLPQDAKAHWLHHGSAAERLAAYAVYEFSENRRQYTKWQLAATNPHYRERLKNVWEKAGGEVKED